MASGGRTGNPWYLFWIVCLLGMDLYCSALPTPTVKDSNKVHVCPNNKTEWQKASKRLNCTRDLKNRYHCLPVRNLTTLMEFCYNETRPRVTSGGCMTYVPESNAMYKLNCSTFYYGCPDILYFSDEIYAFPNCSNINPITRCYVADSFCPLTPAIEGKTTASEFLSIISVLYVLIILFVAGIVGLILYKNRKGKKEDGKTKVGEKKLKKFLRKEKIDISHIRCIIVGCAHAGKTTFLRRLENIQFAKLKNEVKSTEMADIYVNMFEVSEDGETIESVENKSPVIFSLNMVHNHTKATQEMKPSTDTESQTDINDGDMPSNEFETQDSDQNRDDTDTELDRNMMELSTIEATYTLSTHSYENTSLLNGENYSLQTRTEKSHRSNSTDFVSNYGHSNDEKYAMSKIMEALEQLNKNPRPRITFIDFAGQSIYYAFHQIYLSPKTCYILVLDMTKGLNEKVDSDETVGSRFVSWTYKDYYKFWLRSIDSFSDRNAQMIVVGTHAEETSTERVKEFFQKFCAECSSLDLRRHLHSERFFTIGFPKPGSEFEDLEDIKKCIACLSNVTESIRPVWAIFEHIFEKQKEQKIISREMLSMWNNAISKDLQMNYSEISKMLLFFHRVGTLLYFGENNLKETIILDIQWFSDAFKCIIAYHVDIDRDDYHFTGELDDRMLETIWIREENKEYIKYKDIILAYMEKLGLLAICNTQNPVTKDNETWYYIPSMNKRKFEKFEIDDKEFSRSSILCFEFDKQGQLPIFVFYGAIVKCMKIPKWSIFKRNGHNYLYENVACFSYRRFLVKICQSTFQIQVQVCFPPEEVIDRKLKKIQLSIEEILGEFKNYSFKVGYKSINGRFNAEEDNSFVLMEMIPVSKLKCDTCNDEHNKTCWMLKKRPGDRGYVLDVLPRAIKEEIRKSVGLIYIHGKHSGMGFRVGEKYIFTCAHVIKSIKSDSPNIIKADGIIIEFERDKHSKKVNSVNSSAVFCFKPSIVYFDEECNFYVLELVPHEVGTLFPPPVTHFSEIGATRIHLVGHLDGKHMKVESGLMPKWLPEHKDDIEGLFKKKITDFQAKETPRKIFVQTSMQVYSGSPGFTILDGKPCVVLMMVGKYDYSHTGDSLGFGIAMSDIRTKMINSKNKWKRNFASTIFPE